MQTKKEHPILILGEQYQGTLHSVTLELLHAGRRLTGQMNGTLCLLLCGTKQELSQIEKSSLPYPPDTIFCLSPSTEERPFEWEAKAVCSVTQEICPALILCGATSYGRKMSALLSASLETEMLTDIAAIRHNKKEDRLVITKTSVDGKFLSDYTTQLPLAQSQRDCHPVMVSVRPGILGHEDRVPKDSAADSLCSFGQKQNDFAHIKNPVIQEIIVDTSHTDYGDTSFRVTDRRELLSSSDDLTEAKIILSQGRGLPGEEGAALIQDLCTKLHASCGCSRPCADAGWQERSHQIGQSGISVHPTLYLAFGISGAVQHMTGIRADCLIAVNNRQDAPVFKYCDYGIVGDAEAIARRLAELLA